MSLYSSGIEQLQIDRSHSEHNVLNNPYLLLP